MTARGCIRPAVALFVALLAAVPSYAYTVTAPTADPPRRLQILVNANLGGLAVDQAGNRYFSASRYGSVSMIPRGDTRAITIVDQSILPDVLYEPGDIEISASGRALLVADGSGRVVSIPFGLTIELIDGNGVPRTDCTLYAQTDEAGTSPPVRNTGIGLYNIPRLMTQNPAATEQGARVIVECGSEPTRAFDVGLGQPEGLFGHTFIRLVAP